MTPRAGILAPLAPAPLFLAPLVLAAIVVAAIVVALALPAAAQAESPPAWTRSLDTAGWTFVAGTDTLAVWRREPFKGPDGRPRLQVRWEYRQPQATEDGAILSALEIDTFDCPAHRTGLVSAVEYAGRGLTGEEIPYAPAEPLWLTPEPGTAGEALARAACGG